MMDIITMNIIFWPMWTFVSYIPVLMVDYIINKD
jgi:hypothetical protein